MIQGSNAAKGPSHPLQPMVSDDVPSRISELLDRAAWCRFDFLAPPATGKTTLINACLKHAAKQPEREDGHEWIGLAEAAARAERELCAYHLRRLGLAGRVKGFARTASTAISGYVFGAGWCSAETSRQRRIGRVVMSRFLEQQHEFFSSVVAHGWDAAMPARAESVAYLDLLSWTENWLFAHLCYGRVGIVADNSRFTRAAAEMLANPSCGAPGERERLVRVYLESSYAPQGVIHLDASSDLILSRIRHRQETTNCFLHPGHRGLSEIQLRNYTDRVLEVNRQAVEFFSTAGIPVLTLGASEPIRDNVCAVSEFLDTQSNRCRNQPDSSRVPTVS